MKTVTININGKDVQIELTAEQLKQIEVKPRFKRWQPETDKEYYYVEAGGHVDRFIWVNDETDRRLYNLGNCFRTREEAEHVVKKRIARQKLIDRIIELNEVWLPDWSGECIVYTLFFSHRLNEFKLYPCEYVQCTNTELYFKSEEIGIQILKEFTTEELKLAIL